MDKENSLILLFEPLLLNPTPYDWNGNQIKKSNQIK
jgi:hypothetical protein